MRAALTLWWRLRTLGRRDDRVPGVLAVVAFAVATGAMLVALGGLHAFEVRNAGDVAPADQPWPTVGEQYVTLAWVAVTCMVIPILTLGGVAARLAIARRDQRLAAMRLAGATSGQVGVMTLAEAAAQAFVGALAGVGVYALALPVVATLTFQDQPLEVRELVLPVTHIAAVVGVVVLVSVLSGLSSLAKVVITPLGVASRQTPKRLSLLRLAVAAGAALTWFLVIDGMKKPDRMVSVVLLSAVIITMNLVGPFLVMVAGRVAARIAPTAATLLAARRIADDPRSTWRAVGALGLGIVVTGFTMLATSEKTAERSPTQTLIEDMSTGAVVTLAIITVIAATSTGVVQAARVLDQRDEYRALALAGTPIGTLHRARSHEIGLPLGVTVVTSAAFVLVLMLPFMQYVDASLVVRFVAAAVVSAAVMMLAVTASRSLVRQAAAGA